MSPIPTSCTPGTHHDDRGPAYVDVALDRLPVDRPVRLEHGPRGVVVIRTGGGVYAYEDSCPHTGWRLSLGDVEDGRLQCRGHGWTFAIDTGACVDVPGYCLRPLRVIASGASVRIECRDSATHAARPPFGLPSERRPDGGSTHDPHHPIVQRPDTVSRG